MLLNIKWNNFEKLITSTCIFVDYYLKKTSPCLASKECLVLVTNVLVSVQLTVFETAKPDCEN